VGPGLPLAACQALLRTNAKILRLAWELFLIFIALFSGMGYILGMVTTPYILALTEALKTTPALTLTDAQLAALASLATQIEFAIQDRQAEVDEELAQVERFEQDEFIALDDECGREDRFLDSFWESQNECF
jgi:hypothetical protein